jgi:hypothetical protein
MAKITRIFQLRNWRIFGPNSTQGAKLFATKALRLVAEKGDFRSAMEDDVVRDSALAVARSVGLHVLG